MALDITVLRRRASVSRDITDFLLVKPAFEVIQSCNPAVPCWKSVLNVKHSSSFV